MRVFPPTRIIVVGTPFHTSDLFAGTLRRSPLFVWRRYAAELETRSPPVSLTPSLSR